MYICFFCISDTPGRVLSEQSNLSYKAHQIVTLKCFSSRPSVVSAQSIEASCRVDNQNVIGEVATVDAPTTP